MARFASMSIRSCLITSLLCASAASARAQDAVPRPFVEAAVWGGYTDFGGADGPSSSARSGEGGVRSVEVALWPTERLRLFGRFENTLSLDNLELIRADRSVHQYSGGALLDWGGRFTSVAHVGRRTLPGGVDQTLFFGEQVLYLPDGIALKAGGLAGPREDHRTEWLTLAGVSAPVGPRVRIEPTLFYSGTGRAGESQWRGVLMGDVGLAHEVRVGAGVAGGRNESPDEAFTGGVWDSFLWFTTRLGGLN